MSIFNISFFFFFFFGLFFVLSANENKKRLFNSVKEFFFPFKKEEIKQKHTTKERYSFIREKMDCILKQRIFLCLTLVFILNIAATVADDMKCMKEEDYKDLLKVVRVQSSTYQNMKADGSLSGRYYEDTYVLLNVGKESLCNINFMLDLSQNDDDNKEFRTKVSALPPGASPREATKKSELPSPSKKNKKEMMEIYATEGIRLQMESDPIAIYPKVTGRNRDRNNQRILITETEKEQDRDDILTPVEDIDSLIISGTLPNLYLAPNDADMFGFTLSAADNNAPMALPELCVVSYQTCKIDSMHDEQKEQMEEMMHMDESQVTTMEEKKSPYNHPRKKNTGKEEKENINMKNTLMMPQYKSQKRPKWHMHSWMVPERIKLGVHPIPVNHGGKKGKMQIKSSYKERYPSNTNFAVDERYPVNTNFAVDERYPVNSDMPVEMQSEQTDGIDIINWMPAQASRFDVAIVDRPEYLETDMYLALPRISSSRSANEDLETDMYLALPRISSSRSANPHKEEKEKLNIFEGPGLGPGGDRPVGRKTRYLRQ